MKLRARAFAVVTMALLLSLSACHKATFVRNVPPAGPVQAKWNNFFLFGLAGTAEIDIREFCPTGDVRIIRTGGNFGTGLVSLLTAGLYTPRKVWVQCGATQRAQAAIAIRTGEPSAASVRLRPGSEPGTWIAAWDDEEVK